MEQSIADVKTLSFGNKSFYKPGMRGDKAVQLRAAQHAGEYHYLSASSLKVFWKLLRLRIQSTEGFQVNKGQ